MGMGDKFCPQCGNHCPAEQLRCHRGRAYFGFDEKNERGEIIGRVSDDKHGHKHDHSDDEVVELLLKCGRKLHHGKGIERIECLSDDEREQLIALLKKCHKELKNH